MVLPKILLSILLSISLFGCSDSQRQLLEKGVQHAERSFQSLHTNELSRLGFEDMMRQGATLVTYVAADAADDAKLPPFISEGPPRKWAVVLRQDEGTGQILIEGYGENLDKPLLSKKVALPEFE